MDYLDGFQHKSTFDIESWNGEGTYIQDPNEIPVVKLRIIPTSEGYYDVLKQQYIYNFTDHLGNVRLSYSDTNKDGIIQPIAYEVTECRPKMGCFNKWKSGEIIDANNYYPFGLLHNYTVTSTQVYQYKYNGKELQETGMYDYGARMYMPDLGRWGVVDPLAETSRRWSPYTYAFNNPIRFIDPDGREGTDWIKKDNTWTYDANITTAAQAKAAGADDFAKNGSVISDAKIGSNGESGYVKLGEGGSASYSDFNGYVGSVMNQIQSYTAGNYVRESPSLNTQEGAFANPGSQLASTMLTAMQQAPLAIVPEIAAAKLGGLFSKSTTLYRSVSPAELADISANGLRVGETGYATEKLFTTTASDASFFSKSFYPWDKTANTIMKVKVPNSVMKTSGSFIMDGKSTISIPANQLQNIKNIKALNYSPIP